MAILPTSEYLGIRMAMIDALQRYEGWDTSTLNAAGKVGLLQAEIRTACLSNALLGERRELIGEAWARFLATREPEDIQKFINHPATQHAIQNLPPMANRVGTMTWWDAIKFQGTQLLDKKSMANSFEDIARTSGLIDYASGQTLSGFLDEQIARIGAEQDGHIPPRAPEEATIVPSILNVFNSGFGAVAPEALGLTAEQLAALPPDTGAGAPPPPERPRGR